jgi:hypothetical protein
VSDRRPPLDPLRDAAVRALARAGVPFHLALVPVRVLVAPPGEVAFQEAYQGLGVAVLALFPYTHASRALGPMRASLFMSRIPVAAAVLGIPVLGGVPGLVSLAGILMVGAGMARATRAP